MEAAHLLNPEQRGLVELASRLSRERLAPRAATYDTEATFPFENYEDLRANKLLGLIVPAEFGGRGAD